MLVANSAHSESVDADGTGVGAGEDAEEDFSLLFSTLSETAFDAATVVAVVVFLGLVFFFNTERALRSAVIFVFLVAAVAKGGSSVRWRLLLRTGLRRASTSSCGTSTFISLPSMLK